MSLGTILSEARNRAGMTVETLGQKTNIRPTMIREFEADNFSSAGGATYAKGHLRSLATHLKLNASELLAAYDVEQAAEARPIYDRLVENNAAEPRQVRKQVNNKQLIAISILSILVIIGGYAVYSNLRSTDSAPVAVDSPTPTQTPSATATPKTSATPYETVSSGTGVKVVLKAVSGVSWINVTDASGTTLFSGRMNVGDTRTFTSDKEIIARLGNAGGLEVTVNGKKQAPLGQSGEVVTVSYGVNS